MFNVTVLFFSWAEGHLIKQPRKSPAWFYIKCYRIADALAASFPFPGLHLWVTGLQTAEKKEHKRPSDSNRRDMDRHSETTPVLSA